MRISIAICTWNRATMLGHTLRAISALAIPEGFEWEVLVVDNNSTDDTAAVLAAYGDKLPLRRLFEPRQGKSHACNRVIDEVEGDLVLWTDDDVLVDREWLTEYVAAAEEFPDAAFFGGTIEPWFESPPPAWVRRNLSVLRVPFAILEYPVTPQRLTEDTLPFGANYAIRTRSLRQFRFDTALGPRGDTKLCGEEMRLFRQMLASGLHGISVGSARVRHFVSHTRMNLKYVKKWCRETETGEANLWARGEYGKYTELFGMPRWAIRSYVENFVTAIVLRPFGGERWLRALMARERRWALLRETRRLSCAARE